MSYRTPKMRAVGLGSAGAGVEHWWMHRVTSVALIPLTFLALFPFAGALGDGYETALAVYSSPFNAIVAVLFLGTMFHHLMQGLQVVIEDYVHAKGWRTAALLANTMFCAAFGFAGIFAVLKIAFTA